jgi:AcrR family transcriptional regulator
MESGACQKLDPRIRRTRQLLHEALRTLLEKKEFDKISVQDITEAATLNRATFYAHYTDKFALLEESIRVGFLQMLEKRNVRFDGTCPSAFEAILLAVCDFLTEGKCSLSAQQHQFEPYLQRTVIDQVRLVLLEGLRRPPLPGEISAELLASTASWAIFGAANQWVHASERASQEEFVRSAVGLIYPILAGGAVSTPPGN